MEKVTFKRAGKTIILNPANEPNYKKRVAVLKKQGWEQVEVTKSSSSGNINSDNEKLITENKDLKKDLKSFQNQVSELENIVKEKDTYILELENILKEKDNEIDQFKVEIGKLKTNK